MASASQDSPPSNGQSGWRPNRRWLTWLLLIGLIVLIASWFLLKSIVTSRVTAQLDSLGLGKATVGSVSVGSSGISVRDIEFAPAAATPQRHRSKIRELKIRHPLAGLLQGDEQFNAIEIAGGDFQIDLSATNKSSEENRFTLEQLQLPADQIVLSDSSLTIVDSTTEAAVLVSQLAGTLEQDSTGKVKLQGATANFLESDWAIDALANPQADTFSLTATTPAAQLVDQQWQTWPGMPAGLAEVVRGSATGAATLKLQHTNGAAFPALSVEIDLATAKLEFPAFDLPLAISSGQIRVDNQKVQYESIVATVDGTDRLNANGTTQLNGWPLLTNFQGEFQSLSVATIRKLAPDVPQIVQGRADGTVNGSVAVEASLRTTLTLNADARARDARYGLLAAKTSNTQVALSPLILDSEQALESLTGSVIVAGDIAQQDVNDVFATFELPELQQQLDASGTADGDFRFELPLATAEQIETWSLLVNATSASGRIAGQTIEDLKLQATLARGNLKLAPISFVPTADPSAASNTKPSFQPSPDSQREVDVTVDWPLVSTAQHPSEGLVSVGGNGVSAQWMKRAIERQIALATGQSVQAPEPASNVVLEQSEGVIDFQTKLQIPAASPDLLSGWSGSGTVSDSELQAAGQRLRAVGANLALDAGQLSIDNILGQFAGTIDGDSRAPTSEPQQFDSLGQLAGSLQIDLNTGRVAAAKITARAMPVAWVTRVAAEQNPRFARWLASFQPTAVDPTKTGLAGLLGAEFELRPQPDQENQDNSATEAAVANLPAWSVTHKITSERIEINEQVITGLEFAGTADATELRVERGRANFGERGSIDIQGDWHFAKQTGTADATWQSFPLTALWQLLPAGAPPLAGLTSGQLQLRPREPIAANEIPISLAGDFTLKELQLGTLALPAVQYTVETKDNWLSLSSAGPLQSAGEVSLASPYQFEFTATTPTADTAASANPPLRVATKLFDQTIVATLSGGGKVSGQLENTELKTAGRLSASNVRIGAQRVDELVALWNYDNALPQQTALRIEAFGGQISLQGFDSRAPSARLTFEEIDTAAIVKFLKSPPQISGELAGALTLARAQADGTTGTIEGALTLTSKSLLLQQSELSDFSADFQLRGKQLNYAFAGGLLTGRLEGKGTSKLAAFSRVANQQTPEQRISLLPDFGRSEFPLTVQFSNGQLNRVIEELFRSPPPRSLTGAVTCKANLMIKPGQPPTGNGELKLTDISFDRKLLTRQVTTGISISTGQIVLDSLRADLRRGEISGRATLPLNGSPGTYQLDCHHFDLGRLLELVTNDGIAGAGLLDARISGALGSTMTGQGTASITRSKLLGLSGKTLQVPVQFRYRPQRNLGRLEIRRSRFQMFDGNVVGDVTVDFGRVFNLDADLQLARLNTARIFESVANMSNAGQGDLSGHLVLQGNSISAPRDLRGSFAGDLQQAAAFQLPLLEKLARFIGGVQLQANDFNSDKIDLRLSRGKVEIRQLNFTSSLVQLAVNGNAFLDGRLNLNVAARIDKLNQPTLIDQLAGSPLAAVPGTPAAFFAQAAEFLSNRLVFVKVGGTVTRPQIQPDAGRQLREETVRYFLRDSQIFPNENLSDN